MTLRPKVDPATLLTFDPSSINTLPHDCYDDKGNPIRLVGVSSTGKVFACEHTKTVGWWIATEDIRAMPEWGEIEERWINVPDFKAYSSRATADKYASAERTSVLRVAVQKATGKFLSVAREDV